MKKRKLLAAGKEIPFTSEEFLEVMKLMNKSSFSVYEDYSEKADKEESENILHELNNL